MTKLKNLEYPAYLQIGLKNGEVTSVNNKELNHDGVMEVVSYVSEEVGIKAEAVLQKAKSLINNDGDVTLKLYNGTVSKF